MTANRKRLLKIFGICILCYVIFVIFVSILFYHSQNNPIDKVAMTYLWNYSKLEEQYGEIVHIARNTSNKSKKNKTSAKVPYVVETETNEVIVYVNLEKDDEDWKAISFEIIEVRQK